MDSEIKITGEPSQSGESCRFIVDRPVLPDRSAYFADLETAKASPFAEEILGIAGVRGVLITDNIVSIDTHYPVDWPTLGIGNLIRKHLSNGRPIVDDGYFEDIPSEGDLKWVIGDLLNREINPAVASHGGYVELIDVKGNNIYIRMGGGCQGCGAANVTLKQGIEQAIRGLVPKVGEILDTTDHAAGRNPYYAPAK